MNETDAKKIIREFWCGLWPHAKRSEAEIGELGAELLQDFYRFEDVAEFLRKWKLTQKNSPNVSDLVKPFRAKYLQQQANWHGKFPPDSIVTIAIQQTEGSDDDPETALTIFYQRIWESSPRTPSWRQKCFRDLRSAMLHIGGWTFEQAHHHALAIFNDVICVNEEVERRRREELAGRIAEAVKNHREIKGLSEPLFHI